MTPLYHLIAPMILLSALMLGGGTARAEQDTGALISISVLSEARPPVCTAPAGSAVGQCGAGIDTPQPIDRFDAWPEQERESAYAVEGCESKHGQDPRTYDLDAAHGGVMQISKAIWADFFADEYGWTWEDIVLNDVLNHQAARIIWDQANGSWQPWDCAVS